MNKGIYIFGVPLFGVILPFIGKRRIALHRDLSVVDTGEDDILDERGFYFTEPWVIEWLGRGRALTKSSVCHADTGLAVYDDEGAHV
jgi:hypothetical protein